MIQGLLVLNRPDYVYERWHGTLLFYALFLMSLFINTYLARLLPQFEASVLLIHIIGFFCILIPLAYLAPHGSASDVFATFTNGGGWSVDGLSFLIGLSTCQFAFLGVDAAAHMGKSDVASMEHIADDRQRRRLKTHRESFLAACLLLSASMAFWALVCCL